MKEKYYITTAIAYASAIPHIGNVYEVILADAIARFKRLEGYDVYFQTGTDDHGQKIEQNAKNNDLTPKQYTDMISGEIKRIYDLVNISYDSFIRTTDSDHIKVVQDMFEKLIKQGDIYLGKYEGWYSIADESFLSENDVKDGKGPSGDIPVWMSEETYFFRLSKYQKRLIDFISENPSFIEPDSRRNEILNNFLTQKLPDLSISRTSFDWGIKIKSNPKHVVYVWIDALSNYITKIGYDVNNPSDMFKKLWPAELHLVGKDVMRFHTIYWPIILMALGLELPKQVFGHPWVLVDRNKMSKSKGNTLYTDELVKHFGVDPIRYYVLHEIPFKEDGNITYELVIERNNSDLANTIGNLLNRTIGMINKYQDGLVKKVLIDEPFEINLKDKALDLHKKLVNLMNELKVGDALEELMNLSRSANKYIDISKPWELLKEEKFEELSHVLYSLVETIRFLAIYLQAFIPTTAKLMFEQLNIEEQGFESVLEFGLYPEQKIGVAKPIFTRYKLDEKIDEILGKDNEKI